MNYLILITLIILLLLCIYVIYNLLNKVEKLEDMVESYTGFILKMSEIVTASDNLIKEVDEKGTFRSDDEVGIFFNFLKDIQDSLNNFKITGIDGKKTN
jgi:hypothetical protein